VDAYTAIVTKRDTRSYADEPVEDDVLLRLLQAGRMAGSSKNTQPVRFVVVRDRDRIRALATSGDFAAWIPDAPVVVAVVVPNVARDFDAGRAAQNVMLAAHAAGLATCPVGVHHQERARPALGLPDTHRVAMLVTLGHPGPPGPPRPDGARLPLETYVAWEVWPPADGPR
jgi:nitroreductase